MSKAGIHSNRGDGYQTLIAFEWALNILSGLDVGLEWIEIDSVSTPVDDVVVGRSNGTTICCQCKKNQVGHKAWSISDLADELKKAAELLSGDPRAEVRFYSRSPFGELKALAEDSLLYADETTYHSNLSNEKQGTAEKLQKVLDGCAIRLSTYTFLRRTTFENTAELHLLRDRLMERLRTLTSNPAAAYDALWARLDHLGARELRRSDSAASLHRLSKDDLKVVLAGAGCLLTAPVDIAQVRSSFESASAIGRSWRRDIGGERLVSPSVGEIIGAIDQRHRSILVTGLPGAGKTCVMLAVQEELEKRAQFRSDLIPLFIQSREYANAGSAHDRQAIGLPEQWVGQIARLADSAYVVVMVDSLDVLAIAREHAALGYFLAQIERLSVIPNVTVVTACREFDRHYDRRIARMTWGVTISCQPLAWEGTVCPLLEKLNIDAAAIDLTTRELIGNPRELALFVELAQRGGSFNVVTSQALAQRYLDTIVRDDRALGNDAMHAIEAAAKEMLLTRSLAVPVQRFSAPQDVRRVLLSSNVLHETQDGQLTFGHQTLLDVLVISGAIRQGVSLGDFIRSLPPVPFVRPSIRSFVAQLATGNRREFRAQIRLVLTGDQPFHVRRLVAESFAEQAPVDDDWLLLRDLRRQHREVFQVIYAQGLRIEWHHFWMKYLIPQLNIEGDTAALEGHAWRVGSWKDQDLVGVLAFWESVLDRKGPNQLDLASSIAHHIARTDASHSDLFSPLLTKIVGLPRQEYSFIGIALAHGAKAGAIHEKILWGHIAGGFSDDDILSHNFDEKLRCQSHEFGDKDDKFIEEQMRNSTALLDLAVASIEDWSSIRRQRFKSKKRQFLTGFLSETSYADTHTKTDIRHHDGGRILMDAIEHAIADHARRDSAWWKSNKKRLVSNKDFALVYFAIRACTQVPEKNVSVIRQLLLRKSMLDSDLAYEIGTLMQASFLYLTAATQGAVQDAILTIGKRYLTHPEQRRWAIKEQSDLFIAIPCHLRTDAANAVLREIENIEWPVVRTPIIYVGGGWVQPPFAFDVFLDASDEGVVRILGHYRNHLDGFFDSDFRGGEEAVGSQLIEAASRAPSRFIRLLSKSWDEFSESNRDDIMRGVANHLAHRFGGLHAGAEWKPRDEPDGAVLAAELLDVLESHPEHWLHNRVASAAIEGCAHVVATQHDADRLVALAKRFSDVEEECPISGESVGLVARGINMIRGNAADALMICACGLEERGLQWPEILPDALRTFAADKDPAIRSLVLRRLAYLQSIHPGFGWELFDLALAENGPGISSAAERCLYHAYHKNFEIVSSRIANFRRGANDDDLQVWARISALAGLSGHVDMPAFIADLLALKSVEAWRGAASVWAHRENVRSHRSVCIEGISIGMSSENPHAATVAGKFSDFFHGTGATSVIPITLFERFLALIESTGSPTRSDVAGIDAWLNSMSDSDPYFAVQAVEMYLGFAKRMKVHLYDHQKSFTQMLNRLFTYAEDHEIADTGALLHRVAALQDELLALGVTGVDDWLKAAERR